MRHVGSCIGRVKLLIALPNRSPVSKMAKFGSLEPTGGEKGIGFGRGGALVSLHLVLVRSRQPAGAGEGPCRLPGVAQEGRRGSLGPEASGARVMSSTHGTTGWKALSPMVRPARRLRAMR